MAVFQSPFRFFAVSGDIFADRAATIGCAEIIFNSNLGFSHKRAAVYF